VYCNQRITGIGGLGPLLSVEIVHFIVRSDLFKISKSVYDGREIVRTDSLWRVFSVNIDGLENLWDY
jgi:hypothetical protein